MFLEQTKHNTDGSIDLVGRHGYNELCDCDS